MENDSMKIKRTPWLVVLLLAFVVGKETDHLCAQTLNVSYSSTLNFTLKPGALVLGGALQLSIDCPPQSGTATEANACPTQVSVYADFPDFCGLRALVGTTSIPGSVVEAQVNGQMFPFNSPVPPANNGCGAQLYYQAPLRPSPQPTSLPANVYIDLRNYSSVAVGVIYQGTLRITIETF